MGQALKGALPNRNVFIATIFNTDWNCDQVCFEVET